MLEEKHNFKAWLYLAPGLILLLIFIFYPIVNAFNLLFLYNFDYMQQQRDGYTFYHHDPVRVERWAFRDHWNTVVDLAISEDQVYSASGSLSLHRTNLARQNTGFELSLDPEQVDTVVDFNDNILEDYNKDHLTHVFVDTLSGVLLAFHDPDNPDTQHVVRLSPIAGVWQINREISINHNAEITAIFGASASEIYIGFADGHIMAYGNDDTQPDWEYSEHNQHIHQIVHGGGHLYTASADGTTHKINTLTEAKVWEITHNDAAIGVAVDGRNFVYSASADGTMVRVNANNETMYTYTSDAGFTHLRLNRDRQAYLVDNDGVVHRLHENGDVIWTLETESNIDSIALDTRTLTSMTIAFDDGTVEKYDSDATLIAKLRAHEDPLLGVFIDNRDRIYTAGTDGYIYRNDPLNVFANFEANILSVEVDENANVFAGLENGVLVKLDADANVLWTSNVDSHHEALRTIALHENSAIGVGSDQGIVYKLDETGNIVWQHDASAGVVNAVEFDGDGNLVAAYEDGRFIKFDENGNVLWTNTDHDESVNGLHVTVQGDIYTASSDGSVRRFNADGDNVWINTQHADELDEDVLNPQIDVMDVVVDEAEGRVYTVSLDQTLRRLDASDGDQFWMYNRFVRREATHIELYTVELDDAGNIYFGTAPFGSELPTVRRIDEDTRVPIFHNFINTVRSDMFIRALINTFIIVFVSVPVSVIISLLLAVWLNSIKKLQGFFQTVFFLPYVTNAIAIGMAFAVIFNRDYGLINYVLTEIFGMSEGLNWLGRVSIDDDVGAVRQFIQRYLNLPMLSLLVFITWTGLAFKIMVFLSGLQSIDKQYYDAARVDSTPKRRVFRRITIPLLSPMIAYITITSFIGAFKEYTAIVGMFGVDLGPPGDPDRLITIVGLVYKSLDEMGVPGRLSEAAATAIILFMLTLVLTLINMYISKKRVHFN